MGLDGIGGVTMQYMKGLDCSTTIKFNGYSQKV